MCVVIFSYRQHPKYPLVLAANRDEFYDRPTAKAAPWDGFPNIFAGRDLVKKGTWLGVTKTGRFSAVTNYRDRDQRKGALSRGDLVADFLKTDTPAEKYLNDVKSNARIFADFNLIVGEMNSVRNEIFYFSNRQNKIIKLSKGLYGLSNHLLDTPWRKVEKGKVELDILLRDFDLNKEAVFELLSDKTLAEDADLPDTGIGYEREKLLSSIFVETPSYGTRSSTVLTFDAQFKIDLEERAFVRVKKRPPNRRIFKNN